MDGFGFVARTRSESDARETRPPSSVTSRNAPEDRRAGPRSGGLAYIVKGEFDQARAARTRAQDDRLAMARTPRPGRRRFSDRARALVRSCDPIPRSRSWARPRTAAGRSSLPSLRPDVVTLDMMLPVMSGVAATEDIMAHLPDADSHRVGVDEPRRAFQDLRRAGGRRGRRLEKPTRRTSGRGWEKRFLAPSSSSRKIKVITHPPRAARLDAAATDATPAIPGSQRRDRRIGRHRRVDRWARGDRRDPARAARLPFRCRSCSSSTSASRSPRRSRSGSTGRSPPVRARPWTASARELGGRVVLAPAGRHLVVAAGPAAAVGWA